MRIRATELMADMILAGKIPGIGTAELALAARTQASTGVPTTIRMPAVFCQRCSAQLVTHWYAVNPVTDLELVCLFCSIKAEDAGAVVHTLAVVTGEAHPRD